MSVPVRCDRVSCVVALSRPLSLKTNSATPRAPEPNVTCASFARVTRT